MIKKLIITLLLICLCFSIPTYAKSRYKYVYKTVKVTKKEYLGEFYITHYCPCAKCCGVGGGKITASGTRPKAGRTVGVNPRLIPYGTKLKIGKTKGYVAEDTGGGIGWRHLDIYCNSHAEALSKGVSYKKVWAYKTITKKKRYKLKSNSMKGFKNAS